MLKPRLCDIIYLVYIEIAPEGGVNIKKHFLTAAAAIICTVSMTGCTLMYNAETYLKPPKLSEQHEHIYNALINTQGSKINLKYPKAGSYLSAFVIADIDNEPTDEAIVFYEKTNLTGSDLSTLRINFLDQNNGRWDSINDFSAEGNEVERVFISTLGASSTTNVIVGTGSQTGKSAQLFSYNEEKNPDPQSLGSYSVMDVTDINNDSMNELIMINYTQEGNTAQLKWLDRNSTLVSGPVLMLSENTTDVLQLIYGKLSSTTAVYLDSYINTNTIVTEILKPETNGDTIVLTNITADNCNSDQIRGTVRSSSLISRDIDGDGIVEIPLNTVFKGYEDKPETEQINMTNWYILENNMFVRKYSGYYSITDGYAFMIPEKWEDQVTVRSENDNIVFCKYDEKPENQTEIMKICVAGTEETDEIIQENKYSDYIRIYSSGDTVYLACIPDSSSQFSLSPDEIMFNFKILQ